MKLLLGIGNPGFSYHETYHNLGNLFVEFLLKNLDIITFKKSVKYDYYVLEDFCIVKSNVYMNCSFDALREVYLFYKFRSEDICVAHDELGLSKFSVSYKTTEGLNGHNGLRHIAANIGPKFARLRFGIDHPKNFNPSICVSDYVLSKICLSEWDNSFLKGWHLLNDSFLTE